MKKLIIIFCLLHFTLKAQVVVEESFEGPCQSSGLYTFPFLNNSSFPPSGTDSFCISGWIEICGSPDILSDLTIPFNGRYLKGQVYNSEHRVDVIDQNQKFSGAETYAINYDFMVGVSYKLSFMVKKSGHVDSANLILTSEMSSRPINFIPSYYSLPSIPPSAMIIENFTEALSHSEWNLVELLFTPEANYSQLWFRYENEPADLDEIPDGIRKGFVFIDEFELEILDTDNTFQLDADLKACPYSEDFGSIYISDTPLGTTFEFNNIPDQAMISNFDNSLVIFNAPPGEYNISINYPNGEVQEEKYIIDLECCEDCYADFDFTLSEDCSVQFNNDSYYDTAGNTVFEWDFNDGTLGYVYEENPLHQFANMGSYEVCLTIYSNGCANTVCKTVNVTCDLLVNFDTIECEEPLDSCHACFQGFSESSDPNDPIVSWQWEYEGSTTTFTNENEIYLISDWPVQAPDQEVCLTIVTQNGNSATTCKKYPSCSLNFNDPKHLNRNTVADINLDELITVYPNPTNGNFTVQINSFKDITIAIDVLSLDGKIIKSINEENHKEGVIHKTINFNTDLDSGLYVVRIIMDNKIVNKKLIIK